MNLLPNGRFDMILATYKYLVANNSTPFVMVKTDTPGVLVPKHLVVEGANGINGICFNISENATQDLIISEDGVSFSGRFNGESMNVYFPINAIAGMLCPHTQWNVQFIPLSDGSPANNSGSNHEKGDGQGRTKPPHLKLVH